MKTKGRRKSDNVEDIRPAQTAKHQAFIKKDLGERHARRVYDPSWGDEDTDRWNHQRMDPIALSNSINKLTKMKPSSEDRFNTSQSFSRSRPIQTQVTPGKWQTNTRKKK